ncbi:N-acetylmannosamine-6-phosphate 2-epimerase [Sporosarcina sp. E16_3]|uniref:N-acetylmannosamine-6-phosphate 2-epimerase n=1 Tax=Sporosarcina sp. E16_3 TaxID=2789293 RepID=UPI001A90ECE7|nr:N-acetylmannosamine-6-phosphate 2-epimerase [Sporosarcina sp. E16_3]MBO0601670.1 N-acetylmannosamine-6-phosphate 2-epimerase [Sporosarcina sp. E16_3]
MLNKIKNGLVASCQALEDEPLHSSFIMAKLALAADLGGAAGIRANSLRDIQAIKKEVSLPVVGIVKRDYPDSDVFITATKKEVDELIKSGCEMIAMDATLRQRPNGEQLKDIVDYLKTNHPHIQLMADISTLEDALEAERLGFDCVSTTLYGYTKETSGCKLYENDFEFIKIVLNNIRIPVIAEGNILTPEMAKVVISLGAYSVVVGGAISRPQQITRRFVDEIKGV